MEELIERGYDTNPAHIQLLVTGSARLESFRRSGDTAVQLTLHLNREKKEKNIKIRRCDNFFLSLEIKSRWYF